VSIFPVLPVSSGNVSFGSRVESGRPHPLPTAMPISACPRCHESVRLPVHEVPSETMATCPWCGESFVMAEVQELLPPALIIDDLADATPEPVDSPDEADAGEPPTGIEGFEIVSEASPQESTGASNTFVVESDFAEEAPPLQAGFETLQSRPPTKRKKSITSNLLVQAIVGFLLAVPIAAVVLTMFGSPVRLGFWPFTEGKPKQRAPGVSASIPALSSDRWDGASTQFGSQPEEAKVEAEEKAARAAALAAERRSQEAKRAVRTAMDSLHALESQDRDQSKTYWRDVVTTYSAIAALTHDDTVSRPKLAEVLDRLESSDRLADLVAKTSQWIRPGKAAREAEALLNDGVIVAGRIRDGASPTVILDDGNVVRVTGDVPQESSDEPILALGRLVESDDVDSSDEASPQKTIEIIIRRTK